MKKTILLSSIAFFFMVSACTKKATPTVLTEKKQESSTPPIAPTLDNNAQLADGEKLYVARCGKCHELPKPGQYTTAEWPGIMRSMAPKAKMNESMKQMVLAYVTANAKKG